MLTSPPRFSSGSRSSLRQNCLAVGISLSAVLVLILNFQAAPAGAGADPANSAPPLTSVSVDTPANSALDPALLGDGQPEDLRDLHRRIQTAIHGSRVALQLHVTLLELGRHRMQHIPDYTASFFKQERLAGGDLQDLQTIQVKLRHQPFSVYLKWLEGGDTGREVLLVNGQFEDKMLVKLGGLKGRLMPHLKLDPTGAMALKESRYPVVDMGVLNLTDTLLRYRKRDLALETGLRWEMLGDQKVCDRDCYSFLVEYKSREVEPVYRKSITYVDKEFAFPLCVRNFGWPDEGEELAGEALDEATLIEYYGYRELQFTSRLSDVDFDKTNTEYTFRR